MENRLPAYLLINFVGANAYLCRERALSLQGLDQVFEGRCFEKPASWLLGVISYDNNETSIFVKVLDYRCFPTRLPEEQLVHREMLGKVNSIRFKSIDTNGLLVTLGGKNEGTVIRPSTGKFYIGNDNIQTSAGEDSRPFQLNDNDEEDDLPEPGTVRLKNEISVSMKKLNFGFGHVWLKMKVYPVKTPCEIRIPNEHVREEFEAVKNYFSKKIGADKINIRYKMLLRNGEPLEIEAESPEIARINNELIESVKFELVKDGLKKKLQIDIDKSLFNADEYFDRLGLDKKGFNAFYQHDGNLMDDILKVTQTKHYQQLKYLSALHAHHILKLRFVLKPFSFIFLLEGERQYHIIWETLDTAEATYVWPVRKNLADLRLTLKKIEAIIHVVKIQGKTAYINSSEEPFRRLYHDYSNINDGFIRWKSELESIIC